jgi:hypothetical protein
VSYLVPLVQSDSTAQAVATPVTLTTSPVASAQLDVRNYSWVDWKMNITNKGTSLTSVTFAWEYALTDTPAATDWITYKTETVTAGVSTTSPYSVTETTAPVAPLTVGATTQAKGRVMRVLVSGTPTPAGSVIALSAYRRV